MTTNCSAVPGTADRSGVRPGLVVAAEPSSLRCADCGTSLQRTHRTQRTCRPCYHARRKARAAAGISSPEVRPDVLEAAAGQEFVLPDDIGEVRALVDDLVFEIQSIQTQLGNKDRTHPDGRRFTAEEYWTWRHKAAGALHHMLDRQRALKAHLRALQAAQHEAARPTSVSRGLIDRLVLAYRGGRVEETGQLLAELADKWEIR